MTESGGIGFRVRCWPHWRGDLRLAVCQLKMTYTGMYVKGGASKNALADDSCSRLGGRPRRTRVDVPCVCVCVCVCEGVCE